MTIDDHPFIVLIAIRLKVHRFQTRILPTYTSRSHARAFLLTLHLLIDLRHSPNLGMVEEGTTIIYHPSTP